MRYTPFLDEKKIVFNDDVPDSVVNVLDSCLAWIESQIDWGEYQGKKRKPCPEQSFLLAGQPLGMYHCPYCGMMLLAGGPHLSPSSPSMQDPEVLEHYEDEYGQPWPAGYEGDDVGT
jgi:hypothetical protein